MTGRVWGGSNEASDKASIDATELIEVPPVTPAWASAQPQAFEPNPDPDTMEMMFGPLVQGSSVAAMPVATVNPEPVPAPRRWGGADEPAPMSRRQARAATKAAQRSAKRAPKKPSSKARRRLGNIVIGALAMILVVGGGIAVWQGMQLRAIDAPVPENAKCVSTDAKACPLTGPDGNKPITVIKDDGSGADGWSDGSDGSGAGGRDNGVEIEMTVDQMANSSLFIPAVGVYAPVLGTADTKESRHAGWQTLMIPTNPRKVSWYSKGGDLAGGTSGTTLLAGHIAYNGVNGAFRWLANTVPGNIAYTKNANGAVQKWKAVDVFYKLQTDFPQNYWSAEGTRQLVLVTCGGTFRNGHYDFNVFNVFVPAD